jgi:hypothetical protein
MAAPKDPKTNKLDPKQKINTPKFPTKAPGKNSNKGKAPKKMGKC